jgi:hypothetical protein
MQQRRGYGLARLVSVIGLRGPWALKWNSNSYWSDQDRRFPQGGKLYGALVGVSRKLSGGAGAHM